MTRPTMFDPHDHDPHDHDPDRPDPDRPDPDRPDPDRPDPTCPGPPADPLTEPAGAVRITAGAGVDTDGDGAPDTLVVPGAGRDWLAVDTDGDDLADLLVRVDDHGLVASFPLGPPAGLSVDELLGLDPLFDLPGWPHWPA